MNENKLQKRIFQAVLWLVVLAGVGGAGYGVWLSQQSKAEGLLQTSGRIEGDLVVVSTRIGGKVGVLLAREGDTVQPQQVLARLTDDAVHARQAQAGSAALAQDAQLRALKTSLSLLQQESQIQQYAAKAEVVAARAELARAESQVEQNTRERDRIQRLTNEGFMGPQSMERAELALNASMDQVDAARANMHRALQSLRNAQLSPQRIQAKMDEVAAAQAQTETAQARTTEATSYLNELEIQAPTSAHVVERYVNTGETVAAGAPIFGLTDLSKTYLKAYVPEPLIGQLRIGQPAQIWIDAFPDKPFDAKVGYIASRAEFTPKEVQTRDERTKLVFEIRLYPTADSGGKLLPGQPADAMIRLLDNAAWHKPRR